MILDKVISLDCWKKFGIVIESGLQMQFELRMKKIVCANKFGTKYYFDI
jgi:hypothetical protein